MRRLASRVSDPPAPATTSAKALLPVPPITSMDGARRVMAPVSLRTRAQEASALPRTSIAVPAVMSIAPLVDSTWTLRVLAVSSRRSSTEPWVAPIRSVPLVVLMVIWRSLPAFEAMMSPVPASSVTAPVPEAVMLPLTIIFRPVSNRMLPLPLLVTAPAIVVSTSARASRLPAPEVVMATLLLMLRLLLANSDRLPAPLQTMLLLTTRLPSCGPGCSVVTVTLPPPFSVPTIVAASATLMVMFTGSISQWPPGPAATDAASPISSRSIAEVSAKPPETGPVTSIAPSKRVARSAQRITLPPVPALARASIRAPASTVVVSARRSVPVPWRSPPIRTLPPASRPDAVTRAVEATCRCWPVTVTDPPRVAPDASRLPATRTVPSPRPSSSIVPPAPSAEAARITPEVLMTVESSPDAVPAVSTTRPPPASISPVFSTPASARPASPVTAIRATPSPARSMVVVSPEANATVPRRATIAPLLATRPPTSAASPASRTVIDPWFSTRAPAASPPRISSRPSAAKRCASTVRLVATRLPTSTRAVPLNTTPWVFWMITVPGAVICPAIVLSRPEFTRLRVAACAPGWSKATRWSRPTSKLRQSMIARSEDCCTRVSAAVALIEALPCTTLPPCGAWASAGCTASRATVARSSSRRHTPRSASCRDSIQKRDMPGIPLAEYVR